MLRKRDGAAAGVRAVESAMTRAAGTGGDVRAPKKLTQFQGSARGTGTRSNMVSGIASSRLGCQPGEPNRYHHRSSHDRACQTSRPSATHSWKAITMGLLESR